MATVIVKMARRGCHLKGMTQIPLKFKNPTVAVNSKRRKVNIPPYITNGFPKNNVRAILLIILFNNYFPLHGRMNRTYIIKGSRVVESERKTLSAA